MIITTVGKTDDTMTLKLCGRLDANTAATTEERLKKILSPELKHLILDLSELSYISSAGLRSLLVIHVDMSKVGDMVVMHPSDEVMYIFRLTGFTDILTIR